MPLHRIYTEPGLYTAEDKAALAASITSLYTAAGLPAFYVIVLFHELPVDSIYIGNESYSARKASRGGRPFVRILSQHVARTAHGREARNRMTERLAQRFNPWTLDRGYDLEFNIEESAADLARNNGFPFPPPGSEAEAKWVQENAASAFEGPTIADFLDQREREYLASVSQQAK